MKSWNAGRDTADLEILKRCLKGENEAFAEWVQAYQQAVYELSSCFVLDREMAQELTQEIFLKIFSKLRFFRQDSKFPFWMFRLALNYCRDFIQTDKQSIDRFALLESPTQDPSVLLALSPEKQLDLRLERAVSILPATLREVLVLRYFLGFQAPELAQWMGEDVSDLKIRIGTALAQLARQLFKEKASETDHELSLDDQSSETDRLKPLQSLLGDGFGEPELLKIGSEPTLVAEAKKLSESFERVSKQPLPTLDSDFTYQVLQRFSETTRSGLRKLSVFLSVKNIAAFLVLCGISVLFWGIKRRTDPQMKTSDSTFTAGVSSKLLSFESAADPGKKLFFVRFALEKKGAKSVEVTGSFNDWERWTLLPTHPEVGGFSFDFLIKEGRHSYLFVVDQDTWILDPQNPNKAADGLGGWNSVLELVQEQ